ncbi:MAG TPA: hypothetical protein VN381_02090 [Anaerovoracaceae bacterium]|nr:hypothetical protein [Anaerovoracaceae bacterium]
MKRKVLALTLTFVYIFLSLPAVAYANAAEPPALVVIVKNAPEDISLAIVGDNGLKEARKKTAVWETCYAFYHSSIGDGDKVTLSVSGNDESYKLTVDPQYLNGYNSIVTLDFDRRTLEEGKLLSRSILLVTLRVILTLLIEGLIFFAFGFRRKSSWINFVLINLLTQGGLNIALNNDVTPFSSYLIFSLILMEFLVLAAELAAFLTAVKEHKAARRAVYVLAANLASLVLGGYLITVLPV